MTKPTPARLRRLGWLRFAAAVAAALLWGARLILSWILLAPIFFYRAFISPWLPNSCRHVPTCSTYAVEAIRTRGPLVGLALTVWRVLRCNPWGTSGYDPVPPRRRDRRGRGGTDAAQEGAGPASGLASPGEGQAAGAPAAGSGE